MLLAVRALVLPPTEDVETWLKFASLCRKSGRISQARSTLVKLLQVCTLAFWTFMMLPFIFSYFVAVSYLTLFYLVFSMTLRHPMKMYDIMGLLK